MSEQLKIAMLSVHSCPLGNLGGRDTGGMNVYIRELSQELSKKGHMVDIYTRSHQPAHKQVINLVTDGEPNIPYESYPYDTTVAARDTLLSQLGMTEDQDELDAEAITSGADVTWLQDYIVYPQPGNIAPPFIDGWVLEVDSYDDFYWAIESKFGAIFTSIENCATVTSDQSDPAEACVTITPQQE